LTVESVFFDLDGTLLDRDASLAAFVQDQYEYCAALQVVEKATFVERFIELDNHGSVWKDKVYQQLIAEYAIRNVEWPQLLHDYISNFHKYCIGYPNLVQMLTWLKGNHIKIALVSNGFGQFQYDNFKALQIAPFFHEVFISEWEGLRKPDPAIFNRALAQLGVTADRALFVGDHPEHDVRASRTVGMTAIWKRNDRRETVAEADAVIDDLAELIDIVRPLLNE